jgi:hypothetical protein
MNWRSDEGNCESDPIIDKNHFVVDDERRALGLICRQLPAAGFRCEGFTADVSGHTISGSGHQGALHNTIMSALKQASSSTPPR